MTTADNNDRKDIPATATPSEPEYVECQFIREELGQDIDSLVATTQARMGKTAVDELIAHCTGDGYAINAAPSTTERLSVLTEMAKDYLVKPEEKQELDPTHREFILAADASYFEEHYTRTLSIAKPDFWETVIPHLVYRQRKALEKNANYRQLLPYVVFTRITPNQEKEFFMYQRTKLVGEGRLAGKFSIGFGGHIDDSGNQFNKKVFEQEVLKVIRSNVLREITEECRILAPVASEDHNVDHLVQGASQKENRSVVYLREVPQIRQPVILLDNSDDVGRHHVGLVYEVRLPYTTEMETKEEELVGHGWYTHAQLKHGSTEYAFDLENWSKIILDAL